MRPRRSSRSRPPASLDQDPRTAALRLLGRRDYTSAELRDKLLARGYEARSVDRLLGALAADRWLDDRRVAAAHARTAAGVKGRGRHRIERELTARGVDPGVIHDVVGEFLPDDEGAAIAAVLKRKRIRGPLDAQARRRLFQHLLRRGFGAENIGKALRTYGTNDDD